MARKRPRNNRKKLIEVFTFWLERPDKHANDAWLKTLQSDGVAVKTLDDSPQLYPDSVPYMNAFQALGARRWYGEIGPQPIPISEIVCWMDFSGIVGIHERDVYMDTIVTLDNLFLDFARKTRNKPKTPPRKRGTQ